MRDANPILMRRMLALRQFPMFAHADLGELVVVAENVVERQFAATELVDGESLYFVIDGTLATGDRLTRAREVLGVLDVLAHRPTPPTVALVPTRTFELDGADYIDVLEDNFGLMLAAIRELAGCVTVSGRRSELPYVDATRLGLVERMIVLRQQFPFETARLETLSILAHAATEKRFTPGALIRPAESPVDALVVIAGTARAGDRLLGPGDALGFVEALAGARHNLPVEAVTNVRVLETRASTVLDVLEDHTDLALAIGQALARNACVTPGARADLARAHAS